MKNRFFALLILKYEKTIITTPETGAKNLLIEPVLDILYEIRKKGKNDVQFGVILAQKNLYRYYGRKCLVF